jgi:hypothetical protein
VLQLGITAVVLTLGGLFFKRATRGGRSRDVVVENLTKRFGSNVVLDELSFEIADGESPRRDHRLRHPRPGRGHADERSHPRHGRGTHPAGQR